MKKMAVLMAAIALGGCANMTPAQKKWTGVAVGVLVVGAVAANQLDRPVDHGTGGGGQITHPNRR